MSGTIDYEMLDRAKSNVVAMVREQKRGNTPYKQLRMLLKDEGARYWSTHNEFENHEVKISREDALSIVEKRAKEQSALGRALLRMEVNNPSKRYVTDEFTEPYLIDSMKQTENELNRFLDPNKEFSLVLALNVGVVAEFDRSQRKGLTGFVSYLTEKDTHISTLAIRRRMQKEGRLEEQQKYKRS